MPRPLGPRWIVARVRGAPEGATVHFWLAEATVVVVPARASTGSSGVIHRAVAHGRAVLASDLPDHRAVSREEDLALDWYRAGDAASLADALGGLLRDPARRDALVEHNRRSLARSSPRRMVDAYLAAFGRRDRVPFTSVEGHATGMLTVEPVIEA